MNILQKLHDIWYNIKCNLWHHYNLIQPRYLGHTFQDRDTVLVHVMFEVLSQFIEQEQRPLRKDYPLDPNDPETLEYYKIEKELEELYKWWHEYYNKELPIKLDELWNKYDPHYHVETYAPIKQLDEESESQLEEKLIRLIQLRSSLWT